MGSLTLTTTLQSRGPAAAVVLGEEQVAVIGEGARRFPVRARINGHVSESTVTRMRGEFLLGLSKTVRQAAGVQAGDTVDVEITLDAGPREVDVPAALADALAGDGEAREAFEKLARSHRKEYARWVAEAKKPETRERRVAPAPQMLCEGRTRT